MVKPATVQGNRQPVPVQQPQTQNRPVVGGQPVQTQPTVIGSRFQGQGTDGYTPQTQTPQTGIVDPSRPVQDNVNANLYKNGIIFKGKGSRGEEALFVRKSPKNIIDTLVDMNNQGRGAEAVKQIKEVAVQTQLGDLPLPIYTISPDNRATDSGAVSQAGALANSPLLNIVTYLSGADKSTGEFGFEGLVAAVNLLAIGTSSAEFASQASSIGVDPDGVKKLIEDNPNLVDGATSAIKALTVLNQRYKDSSASGKKDYDKLNTSIKELSGATNAPT